MGYLPISFWSGCFKKLGRCALLVECDAASRRSGQMGRRRPHQLGRAGTDTSSRYDDTCTQRQPLLEGQRKRSCPPFVNFLFEGSSLVPWKGKQCLRMAWEGQPAFCNLPRRFPKGRIARCYLPLCPLIEMHLSVVVTVIPSQSYYQLAYDIWAQLLAAAKALIGGVKYFARPSKNTIDRSIPETFGLIHTPGHILSLGRLVFLQNEPHFF
ncbi:hypothetical protein J3A83DRAFT_97032 [Scleroderma citrinum]